MKKVSGLLLGLSLVAFCAIEFPALGGPMNRAWDFAKASVNQPPPGFTFARTGSGRQGNWIITTDEVAPQGRRVLAQIDNDSTSNRFPLAVANELVIRDFHLSVRCKPVSGRVDQACGVVFRLRDENNYY